MPMTVLSHQGFLAPLWRRWPARFDVAALCVGAALPDVIDGLIGLCRGRFGQGVGQGVGHSLLGAFVLGLPLGLGLRHWLCRAALARADLGSGSFWAYAWNRGRRALASGAAAAVLPRGRRRLILASLALGVASHLAFDLISHGHFPWLLPWVRKIPIFPDWWYDTWLRVWLPWKPEGRKVGPHATLWVALSLWGAWLLLAPAVRAWRRERRGAYAGRRA